jgi:hypothetical protein
MEEERKKKGRRRESLQSDAISRSSLVSDSRGVRNGINVFSLSLPCLDLFQLVSTFFSFFLPLLCCQELGISVYLICNIPKAPDCVAFVGVDDTL